MAHALRALYAPYRPRLWPGYLSVMFYKKLQYIFVVTTLISGCSATPIKSSYDGTCIKLKNEQALYKGLNSQYRGDVIAGPIDNSHNREGDKIVGLIEAGTEIRIVRVLRNQDWGWGEFLRVEGRVSSGELSGTIFDIPACVPYHPRPRWITNCTRNPNMFEFNPEITESCQ